MRILRSTLVLLATLAAVGTAAHAQTAPRGVFIHGISSSAMSWDRSQVPTEWVGRGLLSASKAIDYEDIGFYTDLQGELNRIVGQIPTDYEGSPGVVFVGHSQGGVVSRLLYQHIVAGCPEYENPITEVADPTRCGRFDVKGILTFASPHQGAPASKASYGYFPGYIDKKPIIDGMVDDIAAGPFWSTINSIGETAYRGIQNGGLTSTSPGFSSVRAELVGKGLVALALGLGVQEHANRAVSSASGGAIALGIKDKLGPGGSYIARINNPMFNPPQYRSVIGSEEYQAAIRLVGALGSPYSQPGGAGPPYQQHGDLADQYINRLTWLTNVSDLNLPDEATLVLMARSIRSEADAIQVYRSIQMYYGGHEAEFESQARASAIWGFIFSIVTMNPLPLAAGATNAARLEFLAYKWRRGFNALNRLDATHSTIIESYRLEARTAQVPSGQTCERNPNDPFDPYGEDLGFAIEAQFTEFRMTYCAPGVSPQTTYMTRTYYVQVPTPNDGFLVPEFNVWSPSDFKDDRDHNINYPGGGTTSETAGFNHIEIKFDDRDHNDVNLTRRYTIGQRNPPVEEQEGWFRGAFLQQSL